MRSYWVLRLEIILNVGPSDGERISNKEIPGVIQELEDLATDQASDAFTLYLYPLPYVKINIDWERHEYEIIKQKMHFNHYF